MYVAGVGHNLRCAVIPYLPNIFKTCCNCSTVIKPKKFNTKNKNVMAAAANLGQSIFNSFFFVTGHLPAFFMLFCMLGKTVSVTPIKTRSTNKVNFTIGLFIFCLICTGKRPPLLLLTTCQLLFFLVPVVYMSICNCQTCGLPC